MYAYPTPFTPSSLLFWRSLVMVFRTFLISLISFSYIIDCIFSMVFGTPMHG
jgi:hypothetical protein